jgi:hypothetical protein
MQNNAETAGENAQQPEEDWKALSSKLGDSEFLELYDTVRSVENGSGEVFEWMSRQLADRAYKLAMTNNPARLSTTEIKDSNGRARNCVGIDGCYIPLA